MKIINNGCKGSLTMLFVIIAAVVVVAVIVYAMGVSTSPLPLDMAEYFCEKQHKLCEFTGMQFSNGTYAEYVFYTYIDGNMDERIIYKCDSRSCEPSEAIRISRNSKA